MTVEANAKVNLTLEVYGRRADGYHGLRSVVLPVGLADELTIDASPDGEVSSDTGYGDGDLVVRAARALRSACPSAAGMGAKVHVEKRIPVGGGLGGGSADAAATLRALNGLWGLGLGPEELAGIGASVGSDVPALVLAQHYRVPVLMEGRGERVSRLTTRQLADLPHMDDIVVFTPGIFSATSAVYRAFREADRGRGPNDLQPAAIRLYPGIGEAICRLERQGLRRVTMSGSGSAIYGVRKMLESGGGFV